MHPGFGVGHRGGGTEPPIIRPVQERDQFFVWGGCKRRLGRCPCRFTSGVEWGDERGGGHYSLTEGLFGISQTWWQLFLCLCRTRGKGADSHHYSWACERERERVGSLLFSSGLAAVAGCARGCACGFYSSLQTAVQTRALCVYTQSSHTSNPPDGFMSLLAKR